MACMPDCEVLVNKIPKAWVDYEIYCQLVPNNDPNDPHYQVIPKTGAFEVSYKGVVRYSFFAIYITYSKP